MPDTTAQIGAGTNNMVKNKTCIIQKIRKYIRMGIYRCMINDRGMKSDENDR